MLYQPSKKSSNKSRSMPSRKGSSYSAFRKKKLWRNRFNNGFRWLLLITGLVTINLYIFYYRPQTSLPAIHESLQTNPPKTQKSVFTLPNFSFFSSQEAGQTQTNPPLEYFRFTETKLENFNSINQVITNLGVSSLYKNKILTKLESFPSNTTYKKITVYYDRLDKWVALDVETGSGNRIRMVKNSSELFSTFSYEGPIHQKIEVLEGTIQENRNLFDSFPLSESKSLAYSLADIFSFDKDLLVQCAAGDTFKIVIEKIYQGNQFLRYGRILGAKYTSHGESLTAIWHESPSSPGNYYNEQGRPLTRAWLRTPLFVTRSALSSDEIKPTALSIRSVKTNDATSVVYSGYQRTYVRALMSGKLLSCNEPQCKWKIVQGDTEIIYYHADALLPSIKIGQIVKIGQRIGLSSSKNSQKQLLGISILQNHKKMNPFVLAPHLGNPIPTQQKEKFLHESHKILNLL